MKTLKITLLAFAAMLTSATFVACSDANEYSDTNTGNPSFGTSHPEALEGTTWVRGNGIKTNAYGEDIQGYVESIEFYKADSAIVKMSEGNIPASMKATATWTDESNTDKIPHYEYKYSNVTGQVEILKETKNDKGQVSKTTIFTATAAGNVLTVVHYGDTPNTSYLVKK